MSFEDFKEKLAGDAHTTWERIQESTAYNQLRDRYENMTPPMQKLTLVGSFVLIAFLILSVPYSTYIASTDHVGEFESKRMTIRELLKVTRESSDVPQIPQAPPAASIQASIEQQIKAANLLPEQIKGTQILENNSNLIPKNLTESLVQVSLAKLNIRQIVDLGFGFQNINPSVKMKDLMITANREDSRYFDVVYKLVSLAVPAAPAPEVQEPARGSGKKSRQQRNGDE